MKFFYQIMILVASLIILSNLVMGSPRNIMPPNYTVPRGCLPLPLELGFTMRCLDIHGTARVYCRRQCQQRVITGFLLHKAFCLNEEARYCLCVICPIEDAPDTIHDFNKEISNPDGAGFSNPYGAGFSNSHEAGFSNPYGTVFPNSHEMGSSNPYGTDYSNSHGTRFSNPYGTEFSNSHGMGSSNPHGMGSSNPHGTGSSNPHGMGFGGLH